MTLKVDDKRAAEIEIGLRLPTIKGPPGEFYQGIIDLLADRATLLAEIERLRGYVEHSLRCVLQSFEQYDPAQGYKYGGEWLSAPPDCTCGLDPKGIARIL